MVATSRTYDLTIFVAGQTLPSVAAIENLRSVCETELAGDYHLEVVDVMKDPVAAAQHRILATPAVVKRAPKPVRTIVGDLSDREKVMVGLDLIDFHV